MRIAKLSIILILFAGLSLPFLFQNCTQSNFGGPGAAARGPDGTTTASNGPTGGNGDWYEGKVYVEYQAGGNCPDGSPLKAKIVLTSAKSGQLVRENCADVVPPKTIAGVQDFTLDPLRPDQLIYGSRTFVAQFQTELWARSGTQASAIHFSSGNVGIGVEAPAARLDVVAPNTGIGQPAEQGIIAQVRDGLGRPSISVFGGMDGSGYSGTPAALKVGHAPTGNSIEANGNVLVTGVVFMGHEVRMENCAAQACDVSCSAGKVLLSGGCNVNGTSLNQSYPISPTTWRCLASAPPNFINAYAICARMQ